MIDNTRRAMSEPATRQAFLLNSLVNGTDATIQQQEKRGQQQLLHSDRLPVDSRGEDADFERLGFTFGQPDPDDPLFRPATLPAGWTHQASDHDMWSYLVDAHGRRRVGLFYKAAFYDRRADMCLVSVDRYVVGCQADGTPIVTDDTWATPAAVSDAIRRKLEHIADSISTWSDAGAGRSEAAAAYAVTRLEELTEERISFTALLAEFEAATL